MSTTSCEMRESNALDCCAGELRLPFFPAASLFSVVRKGTLVAFRSIGCAQSNDHAVCWTDTVLTAAQHAVETAVCRTGPRGLCRMCHANDILPFRQLLQG